MICSINNNDCFEILVPRSKQKKEKCYDELKRRATDPTYGIDFFKEDSQFIFYSEKEQLEAYRWYLRYWNLATNHQMGSISHLTQIPFSLTRSTVLTEEQQEAYSIMHYEMLYPALTRFFTEAEAFDSTVALKDNVHYNLMDLVEKQFTLQKLEACLDIKDQHMFERIIEDVSLPFWHFYRQVLPYLEFATVKSYSLKRVQKVKNYAEVYNLPSPISDQILSLVPQAKNNQKVLQFLKKASLRCEKGSLLK